MMTPQHQLYHGITDLLKRALDTELGLITRIYLADDISSLLFELVENEEHCFLRHEIPSPLLEMNMGVNLGVVINSNELAATYLQLAVLHYEIREEAFLILTIPKPGLVNESEMQIAKFLSKRNNNIRSAYHKASQLNPAIILPKEPKKRAKDIYTLVAEDDMRTALSEFETAYLSNSRNLFEQAASTFLKATSVTDDALLYGKAGFCLLYAGKYADAILYSTQAFHLDPQLARFVRSEANLKLGNYQKSLEDIIPFVLAEPDFPDGYAIQGDTLRKIGRTEEAAKNYNTALIKAIEIPEQQRDFSHYFYGVRAERGLQKLGKSTSTKFEQEAIKEGYHKIGEIMKEYD